REARDRRLAQLPRDPIDAALWANFQQAREKAKTEKQKSETRKKKSEVRSQKDGTIGNGESTIGNPDPQIRDSESSGEQSSIDNHQSAIPRPSAILDDLHLQWRVERLIGVFLLSETYHAFKAAEQYNRTVEEAFRALGRALE